MFSVPYCFQVRFYIWDVGMSCIFSVYKGQQFPITRLEPSWTGRPWFLLSVIGNICHRRIKIFQNTLARLCQIWDWCCWYKEWQIGEFVWWALSLSLADPLIINYADNPWSKLVIPSPHWLIYPLTCPLPLPHPPKRAKLMLKMHHEIRLLLPT